MAMLTRNVQLLEFCDSLCWTKPFGKNWNLQVFNKEKGGFMYFSRLGLKEQLLESPRFDVFPFKSIH